MNTQNCPSCYSWKSSLLPLCAYKATVAVQTLKAWELQMNHKTNFQCCDQILYEILSCMCTFIVLATVKFGCRERKKRIEKPRRFSRSHSRSPSPPPFRGRNTAMDAQEALARRSEIVVVLMICDMNKLLMLILHVWIFLFSYISRLERAKKLQEQREKEMVEKQKQQEMAAGSAGVWDEFLSSRMSGR